MSRKAKGKRPYFFENPESDKLLAIIMAVAGELSVVRDRLDTVERLLEQKGSLTRADIEDYEPDESVREARHAWREVYLERVLRIVHHELESEKAGESREGYEQAIADLAES
ncbi:hypothetical protein PC39_07404 [Salinisphaera sp. PC39]|uniref:hypothetical protein n=1 Tax=Salinisphaera sp. PC39 TaxID=1304156 RepID=UPI003340B031